MYFYRLCINYINYIPIPENKIQKQWFRFGFNDDVSNLNVNFASKTCLFWMLALSSLVEIGCRCRMSALMMEAVNTCETSCQFLQTITQGTLPGC